MRNLAKAVFVLLVTVNFTSVAANNLTQQLRGDLSQLSEKLKWNNGTYATYSPIEEAAMKAFSTLDSISNDQPGAIPRASELKEMLERLIAESQYFVKLSTPKTYQQGFLDSTTLLTDAVDEWRHAIDVISTKLDRPSKFCYPKIGSVTASEISSGAVAGTHFRDMDNASTMVVIPAGCFIAGTSDQELQRWKVMSTAWEFERPRRRVCITKPIAVGRTEVTVAEFDHFVQSTGYELRGGARWWITQPAPSQMVFNPDLDYLHPGFPQTRHSPVVAIRWQDAVAYADWLSAMTGNKYRLPTEEEWEWAARGGSDTTFFWGNEIDQANTYANTYDYTSKKINNFPWPAVPVNDGFPYTAPVASFSPNGYGLFDVTGNAREFVADSWVPNLSKALNNGSAHKGPVQFRVIRGGAWNYNARNYRIRYRNGYLSSEVATNMFGFRLVRDL